MKNVVAIERSCYCFCSNIFIYIDFKQSEIAFKKTNRVEISDDEWNQDKQTFLSVLYS